MRRSLWSWLIVLIVCLAVPASLVAQGQGGGGGGGAQPQAGGGGEPGDPDTQAPWNVLETPADGRVYTQYPTLWIRHCDDRALDNSTRIIKVNGVTKTSSFSWLGQGAISGCPVRGRSSTTSVALNPGSNSIYVRICDPTGNCGINTFSVYRLEGPMPTVSLAPHSADLQDYARCAMACFAATYAQSTVPYYSLDTPRSVTLAYNSDRVDPKPFVHVDVTPPAGSTLPQYYVLKVRRSGQPNITFLNGESELRFAPPLAGVPLRLGGQFSAASNAMGATASYPVTVVVGAQYASSYAEDTVATRVLVANETDSPIARGWTVAGIQRLFSQADGAVISEGNGSALFFSKSGSTYLTPTGDFSRLTVTGSGSGTTYTRAFPDSTKITYNYLGLMTQVADRFGNANTVLYDGANRPSWLQDPRSNWHNLVYDANGLDRITDVYGRTTQVTVAANRTLTQFVDLDNVATTFGYDASLRLSTITDRRGTLAAELAYHGASDKLASTTGPTIGIGVGQSGRPVAAFTPWQRLGVPYGATIGSPFTAVRTDSIRAVVTDPGGHASRFTVNAFGQPLAAADPLGNVTTIAYTAAGLVDTVINPLGVNAGYDYDASGNVTRSQVGGTTTRAAYTASRWALPDSVWGDVMPTQRYFIRSGQPSLNGVVDSVRLIGQARSTRYVHDLRGRLSQAWDPDSHLVQQTWFASGYVENRSKDSIPGGRVTTYAYDGIGRLIRTARPGLAAESLAYDTLNRVVRVFDGVNPLPTIYAYDNLFLTAVTDPRNQVYGFASDALGRVVRRVDPLGRADTVDYNADGLVLRSVNRAGQAVALGYDALHRRRARAGAQIVQDTTAYSADARIVSVTNANSAVTAYLGGARRQTDSVRTTLTIPGVGTQTYWHRYTYRWNGPLDSVHATGPGGLVFTGRKYGYGPFQTLDSIRLGGTALTRFTYNQDLNATMIRLPGSDSITIGRVTAHNTSVLTSRVMSLSYFRDVAGRIAQEPGSNYTYDGLGRLASREFWSGATQCEQPPQGGDDYGQYCTAVADSIHTYHYDAVGNRDTTRSALPNSPPHAVITGTFGAGNRIQSFAGCTYTTDSLLGMVRTRTCPSEPVVTFSWLADERLTAVRIAGGDSIAFAYDALGRLVRRDVNGAVASNFLWEGTSLFAEVGAAGGSRLGEYSYYPGLDQPHAFIAASGTRHYAHQDALGNVRGLTDGVTVTRTYAFDAFGLLTGGNSGTVGAGDYDRARWKGALELAPQVGLHYLRNRWYDPRTGRFLSEDPIGVAGGLNTYSFANADPIGGADPFGLTPCELKANETHWDRTYAAGSIGDTPLRGTWGYTQHPCDGGPGGGGGRASGGSSATRGRSGGGGGGGSRAVTSPSRIGRAVDDVVSRFAPIVAVSAFLGSTAVSFITGGGASSFLDDVIAAFDPYKADAFHRFPQSVAAFAESGYLTFGSNGYVQLNIPGTYMGYDGTFQIGKRDGRIVHWFFERNEGQ